MIIAGEADLAGVLDALRAHRPVFHSEADFQHAFAWEVQRAAPQARVRLETRPVAGVRLDLLVTAADGTTSSAIELKYLTRAWSGEVGAERFELMSQGAQDIRAYDVVKDVSRVEHDVAVLPKCNGAVLCLTNDPSYWARPSHDRETNAAMFRLYEGRRLQGDCRWGPLTGAGTMKGREQAIRLTGTYDLRWQDWARVPGAAGTFRMLVVEVGAADSG